MKDNIKTAIICLIIVTSAILFIYLTKTDYRDDCQWAELFRSYEEIGFESKALNDTTYSYDMFLFVNYYPEKAMLHALYQADYLEIPEYYCWVFTIMEHTFKDSFIPTPLLISYLQKGAELGNENCIHRLRELEKRDDKSD